MSSTIVTIPKPLYEVAFNADPNQNLIPPYYTDISTRVLFAWQTAAGRQYEQDVNESREWHPWLRNDDGALDPSNAASPYAPGIVPYRGMRIRVPVAPTQNMLPQNIATGGSTNGNVTGWGFPVAGSLAYATGLTAAPSGQTVAAAWTTPSGTTSASPVLLGANAAGPMADIIQVTAGLAYTASVYALRASSADATLAVTASIVWYGVTAGAVTAISTTSGTPVTLATGAWNRLTVSGTAPAGAMWGRIQVAITTPATTTATNIVYLTGVQAEQAAAATSWADPGVTKYIINGFIERWPQTWQQLAGTYGESDVIGVDAFAALAQYTLLPPFVNEVLALNPNFFYTLSDPATSTVCADAAGKRVAAPVENSPSGAGSVVFGNSITPTPPAAGSFQGTPGPIATFNNNPNLGFPAENLPETFVSIHKTTATPGPPVNGNWTRILHFRCSVTPPSNGGYELWEALPATYNQGGNLSFFRIGIGIGGPSLLIDATGASGVGGGYTSPTGMCDGLWHQAALSIDGAGNAVAYVDGVSVSTWTVGLPFVGFASDCVGAHVEIGAGLYFRGVVGDMACVAEFPAVLTPTQITNLYQSWRNASPGESTGARINRVLNWIGWLGPTAIDNGQTTSMGPASDLDGATALDALNNITLTENGNFYASAAGVLTFKARNDRYNRVVPAYTFGEKTALGEWPYEVLHFEDDPSHIANIVQVTQYQGPTFTAADVPSQKRNFPRTYQRTVNTTSTTEAQAAATYLLQRYKTARMRIDVLRLHPSAVPGLFTVCLSLELGTRIRVNRRPQQAPQITFDGFVEKIDWEWNPDTGDVYVNLQCSPADLTKYWVLAALHTTLAAQANSGTNTITINALPDAAVNMLRQSLPSGYQLTLDPGNPALAETVTIAAGGIPVTSVGYSAAVLTLTANLVNTHSSGAIVCEPLPAGVTDPTTYDSQSVLGAAATTFNQAATAGTNTITINALPDAAVNAIASSVPQSWTIWLSPGTANFETATVAATGVPVTYPNYSTVTLTLTANLAHNHAVGDIVCDPLPGGDTNPNQVPATTVPAY